MSEKKTSYQAIGLDLFDTLGNSIFLLEQEEDDSKAMKGRIAALQDLQSKVKAKLLLDAAQKIQITPPDPALIKTVIAASKALDDAVDNANLATDFLTLATTAVNAWQAANPKAPV
jgi:hypothetical protein